MSVLWRRIRKWISNVFWLLLKYKNFKRYCSEALGVDAIRPFRWSRWHNGAHCFTAKLKDFGRPVFIKTDGVFFLAKNEVRMTRLFFATLPVNSPRIVCFDQSSLMRIIVFEYVKGKTLEDILSMPCEDVCWPKFYNDLLTILDNLYRLKMIHRDITPSNLLIQLENRKNYLGIKLIDFAFAVISGDTCVGPKVEKAKIVDLGLGMNPKPYLWDDAYSSLQIIKKIERCSGQYFPFWREQFKKRVGRLTYTFQSF